MVFVDRRRELRLLDEAYSRGGSLVVVYGRRRIGKTRLLLEWSRGKRSVYYLAGPWSHQQNLGELSQAIAEQLGLSVFKDAQFTSLDALLRTLVDILGREEKVVLVIDEFTYWVQGDPRVAVELQRFIDLHLPQTSLTLVLSGSIVGVMERGIIGPRAPLYGRARYRLRLGPLAPWCLREFAPEYSEAQLVELYSLVGGVPFYLENLNTRGKTPLEAYLSLFAPGAPLADEALLTYREEFRDPSPYASLVKTIAQRGPLGLGKAAELSGMPTSHASRYLFTLQALGIVEPVPLWGFKRRLYRVSDQLLASWYTVIEPHIHSLHAGVRSEALQKDFNKTVAREWEFLARDHALMESIRTRGLKTPTAGKLLRKEAEIDWLIHDKEAQVLMPVEAKWATLDRREAAKIVKRARTLAASVLRETPSYDIHPLLYVRECRGCSSDLRENVVTVSELPWGECS